MPPSGILQRRVFSADIRVECGLSVGRVEELLRLCLGRVIDLFQSLRNGCGHGVPTLTSLSIKLGGELGPAFGAESGGLILGQVISSELGS